MEDKVLLGVKSLKARIIISEDYIYLLDKWRKSAHKSNFMATSRKKIAHNLSRDQDKD